MCLVGDKGLVYGADWALDSASDAQWFCNFDRLEVLFEGKSL